MVNEMEDVRAKGKAAYDVLMEVLSKDRKHEEVRAIRRFLDNLLGKTESRRLTLFDLDEIFFVVLIDNYIFFAPRPAFAGNDFLILPLFEDLSVEPERILIMEKEIRTHPGFSIPRYVRLCLRRAKKREMI